MSYIASFDKLCAFSMLYYALIAKMKRGVYMSTNDDGCQNIVGKKCGTITVSVYRDINSGSPIFYVEPDNEDILPVSYVIEDVLKLY